jgi:ATP-dependent helicase/nuclease subunit A
VAAASEMKQKLVNKIYASARENSANYSRLLQQLDNIPFANICTIDSFCLGVFQKYFALINRDPSCGMLDPDEFCAVLNGIIDSVCEEYINAEDEEFFALAQHFSQSRRLDTLKEAIISLYNFVISQENFEKYKVDVLQNENIDAKILDYFRAYFHKRLVLLIDDTSSYMRILPFDDKDEIEKIKYLYSQLNRLTEESDLVVALQNLLILCENKKPKVSKKCLIKDEIKEFYKQLKNAKDEFASYYLLLKDKKEGKHKEKLVEIVLKVQEEYLQYKLKRNLVDFDDLKHYTLQILKNDKAKEEIKSNLDYIFVDEYQDTDYLQEAMLNAISTGDNVFVVGDMKQSIYRFRYAEPKIFYTRMHEYHSLKTGTNIPLSTNYRSDGRILEFVNEACSEIMTEEFCNIDYKDGAMLSAGMTFVKMSEEPACAIYTYTKSAEREKRQGYYSVKEEILENKVDTESVFVVNKIKELVSSTFIDTGKEQRKIKYKDIALLSMRRKNFKDIMTELDKAKIPYNLDSETSENDERLEVLIDFIRILTNMSQDIPLANVLTSKMFDFELSELISIQKENPQSTFSEAFYTYSVDNLLKKKIDKFLSILEQYRFKASYMKATDLIVEIMSYGYDAYLLSQGEQVIKKINSFIQYIAERKENDSIEEFVYFYDNNYKGNKTNNDNDAITVTTIHKSKGLEYPVVFIVGAQSAINTRQNAAKFYTDKEFGIAVKSFDDEAYKVEDNFATEVFKLKAKTEERQELARLLYVAITRAKNHLIITGCVAKEEKVKDLISANSFMDFFLYVKQRNGKFASYFNEISIENTAEIEVIEEKAVENKQIDLKVLDKKYPYQESTTSIAKYSVSKLLEIGSEDSKVKKLFDHVEADTGTNYHAILQYINYNAKSQEEIQKEISRLVLENRINIEDAKKMDLALLEKIMNGEIISLARNNKTVREQPFMLYTNSIDDATTLQDKVLVQGVIDLVIFSEKVILVDFKASFGSPKYLKEKYSKQLELYAKAVEEIMGYAVDRKVIYNICKNFVVEL